MIYEKKVRLRKTDTCKKKLINKMSDENGNKTTDHAALLTKTYYFKHSHILLFNN